MLIFPALRFHFILYAHPARIAFFGDDARVHGFEDFAAGLRRMRTAHAECTAADDRVA